MKVKDLVTLLLKENQEADVCCMSSYAGGTRKVVKLDRGWFLTDIPGQFIGDGVDELFAKHAETIYNKPLLDLSSPCITDAVFLRLAKYSDG